MKTMTMLEAIGVISFGVANITCLIQQNYIGASIFSVIILMIITTDKRDEAK